ncbi:MFS transporter [Chloroflexota bacterium]
MGNRSNEDGGVKNNPGVVRVHGIASLRKLRTFNSFKNPGFRIYYGGLLGQMAGMNMQRIARSLLVYRMTGSATILSIMFLAEAVPMLCLSLFGGVIADRIQKKYVMLVGQGASTLVTLGVALALTLGYLSTENSNSWWLLIIASVLQGIIMGLMMPSRQAILPEIVNEEELMNAVSLATMGMNVLQIIAPALAGFLIAAFDFDIVYYAMTGTYLISVVFIIFLPTADKVKTVITSALAEIQEGLSYIKHNTTILIILLATLFMVVLSMPFMQLLPVFTEDILNVGASGLGILMSVSGAGAIAGSLLFASLPNKKRGLMLLAGSLLLGLTLTGFSFSTSWPLSLGLMFFIGISQSARMSLSTTLIQYYVDSTYRGRVMSVLMMQFGLTSFSTFLAGLMTDYIGIEWSVGGFAIILVIFSILALAFIRRIRDLD